MHKTKKMLWMVINTIASFIALTISIVSFNRPSHPVIATVDVGSIFFKASQTLAASHPKGEVPKAVLNRFTQHMKETIYTFGKENNFLIFSKQALLSGEYDDVTDLIEATLMPKKNEDSSNGL
jgi:hypothetical protein